MKYLSDDRCISAFASVADIITIEENLIIYNGGEYSLDDGESIEDTIIGETTQILGAETANITVSLLNTEPVRAKMLVSGAELVILGSGSLILNNEDTSVSDMGVYGIFAATILSISGGASVKATGLESGVYVGEDEEAAIMVSGASSLTGRSSDTIGGENGNYGIFCFGSITVLDNSKIAGISGKEIAMSRGIYFSPSLSLPMNLNDSEAIGIGETGIGAGGSINLVNSRAVGQGGTGSDGYGILVGEAASISIDENSCLTGVCGELGYAGVATNNSSGITVNGRLKGFGGSYGIITESEGSIVVPDGGKVTGVGNTHGVTSTGSIEVGGIVKGRGSMVGIYAQENIIVDGGTIEGFALSAGTDTESDDAVIIPDVFTITGDFMGAIGANGTISAVNGGIIVENYNEPEFFNRVYRLPNVTGQSITSYLNYDWCISSGSGRIQVSSTGEGIRAIQSGQGILTGVRTGPAEGEIILLDESGTHRINIQAELEALYTVTYNANGATGGVVPVETGEFTLCDIVTVRGNEGCLFRQGCVFMGWSTNPTGCGCIFRPCNRFRMPADDVVLYAVWRNPVCLFLPMLFLLKR